MTFHLDMNVLRGLMTIAWMLMFLGIVWWAFHPRSRKGFDAAALLPFADDESTAHSSALPASHDQEPR